MVNDALGTPPLTDTSSNQDGTAHQPTPFTRRPSLSSSSARIFPIKSVAHPLLKRAASDTSDGGKGGQPQQQQKSSPVLASPSEHPSSEDKPASLDPFLDQPTTHAKVENTTPTPVDNDKASTVQDGGSMSSDKLFHMTTRFEHKVGEDGEHLVVTGRNAQIQRCEDEPIHSPGAVQAFGVLIAFDKREDGSLVVQQVSENSRFIIGIPPSALFRAQSLGNLLHPDEIDTLLDAIDSIEEQDEEDEDLDKDDGIPCESEVDNEGPVYFELSGQGMPGTDPSDPNGRLRWDCHCALHRPDPVGQPARYILELELTDDQVNPLKTAVNKGSSVPGAAGQDGEEEEELHGMELDQPAQPSQEDLMESTVSLVKPLRALTRMRNRRGKRTTGPTETDFVGLLSQINDQLSKANELPAFLKIVACVFAELTEFNRCMLYQFDENWNGRVVAEQVDYSKTRDLFRGLNFPATDIPAQAREMYRINKVRLLYDRDQPTARMCCRSIEEVDKPLDMTHCLLRAMSPIHIKYLSNMGVRSSMSVSITAFGGLWGLIALHTYGKFGTRVPFPVRQLSKLLGESISRNIERLSYAARLNARKLINTEPTEANPTGFIVAKSEDLLSLFDADFGVLSIGDEAKILGSISNSQQVLALLEYLRVKQYTEIEATQDIRTSWKDLDPSLTFDGIAGALVIPLMTNGVDFIVFFRRGQVQEVHWAGNPYSSPDNIKPLEPRKSFKTWSEKIVGRSRAWRDEDLETAASVAIVYSKFIAVWREKQNAVAANQLNGILLANASHEVRTPLNAIVNYLELALDSEVPPEVRDNIARSHAASKSLIHVINDLLDLTRAERGQDLSLQEPFNFPETLNEALEIHKEEAQRRGMTLEVIESPSGTPPILLGDRAKIRIIVLRLVENALKHTSKGGILVEWGETSVGAESMEGEDPNVKREEDIRISVSITDTGSGISEAKLESIFREFEQVTSSSDLNEVGGEETQGAVGLGLAVVARIVRTLGGQLRVESKVGEGSRFTIILPFRLAPMDAADSHDNRSLVSRSSGSVRPSTSRTISFKGRRTTSSNGSRAGSGGSDINSLIADMSSALQPQSSNSATGSQTSSLGRRGGSSLAKSMSSHDSRSNGTGPMSSLRNSADRRSNGRSSGGGSVNTRGQPPRARAGSASINDSGFPIRALRMGPPQQLRSTGGGDEAVAGQATPKPMQEFSNGHEQDHERGHEDNTSANAPVNQGDVKVRDFEKEEEEAQYEQHQKDKQDKNDPSSKTKSNEGHSKNQSDSKNGMAPASSGAQQNSIKPMKVLVVEDDRVNRMILQRRLVTDGHECVLAEHGRQAMDILEKEFDTFDLVLMDLLMPIMGGLEATTEIRKLEERLPPRKGDAPRSIALNGRMPVIAVTASLPEREKHTIVDAGLDGWLLKPLNVDRLRALLKGTVDPPTRTANLYRAGVWEGGGFLAEPPAMHDDSEAQSGQDDDDEYEH